MPTVFQFQVLNSELISDLAWFLLKHWPRLPREAVAAPSLAVLKARLDGAWSTLGWWKMSLLLAGGLELDDL